MSIIDRYDKVPRIRHNCRRLRGPFGSFDGRTKSESGPAQKFAAFTFEQANQVQTHGGLGQWSCVR